MVTDDDVGAGLGKGCCQRPLAWIGCGLKFTAPVNRDDDEISFIP
jgi:hypothetical protein